MSDPIVISKAGFPLQDIADDDRLMNSALRDDSPRADGGGARGNKFGAALGHALIDEGIAPSDEAATVFGGEIALSPGQDASAKARGEQAAPQASRRQELLRLVESRMRPASRKKTDQPDSDAVPILARTSEPALATVQADESFLGVAAEPIRTERSAEPVRDDIESKTSDEPKTTFERKSVSEPATASEQKTVPDPKTDLEPKKTFEPNTTFEQMTSAEPRTSAEPVKDASDESVPAKDTPAPEKPVVLVEAAPEPRLESKEPDPVRTDEAPAEPADPPIVQPRTSEPKGKSATPEKEVSSHAAPSSADNDDRTQPELPSKSQAPDAIAEMRAPAAAKVDIARKAVATSVAWLGSKAKGPDPVRADVTRSSSPATPLPMPMATPVPVRSSPITAPVLAPVTLAVPQAQPLPQPMPVPPAMLNLPPAAPVMAAAPLLMPPASPVPTSSVNPPVMAETLLPVGITSEMPINAQSIAEVDVLPGRPLDLMGAVESMDPPSISDGALPPIDAGHPPLAEATEPLPSVVPEPTFPPARVVADQDPVVAAPLSSAETVPDHGPQSGSLHLAATERVAAPQHLALSGRPMPTAPLSVQLAGVPQFGSAPLIIGRMTFQHTALPMRIVYDAQSARRWWHWYQNYTQVLPKVTYTARGNLLPGTATEFERR